MSPTRAAVAILVLLACQSASGLPTGYKEDFNGCASSPDADDRTRCCSETHSDCTDQCKTDHPNDIEASLQCSQGCFLAAVDCRDGKQVQKAVDWPGSSGGETVPGILGEGNRLLPAEGARVRSSRDSVAIDVIADDPIAPFDCLTLLVRCACPPEVLAAGSECRAARSEEGTECLQCPRRGAARCKPCETCRPVVQSVQACEVPALRERSDPKPK